MINNVAGYPLAFRDEVRDIQIPLVGHDRVRGIQTTHCVLHVINNIAGYPLAFMDEVCETRGVRDTCMCTHMLLYADVQRDVFIDFVLNNLSS